MNSWRNAITCQDFTSPKIALKEVREFRSAYEGVAVSLDDAGLLHIKAVAGPPLAGKLSSWRKR